jgi:ABC-type uncharacterized transport system permease subunit
MGHPGKIESKYLVRHKRSKHGPLVRLEYAMLWTILVVLCVLWLLGVVTSYTAGGLIHLLLLAALVVLVINLVSGRRRMV